MHGWQNKDKEVSDNFKQDGFYLRNVILKF